MLNVTGSGTETDHEDIDWSCLLQETFDIRNTRPDFIFWNTL